MPVTLQQTLLARDIRRDVLTDCFTLIDQEMAGLSGVSGTAVKLAFKTVNTFLPGHVYHMVEILLPDMVTQLEPFWADFAASPAARNSATTWPSAAMRCRRPCSR
jgi:hypothetical protein